MREKRHRRCKRLEPSTCRPAHAALCHGRSVCCGHCGSYLWQPQLHGAPFDCVRWWTNGVGEMYEWVCAMTEYVSGSWSSRKLPYDLFSQRHRSPRTKQKDLVTAAYLPTRKNALAMRQLCGSVRSTNMICKIWELHLTTEANTVATGVS